MKQKYQELEHEHEIVAFIVEYEPQIKAHVGHLFVNKAIQAEELKQSIEHLKMALDRLEILYQNSIDITYRRNNNN